MTCTRKYGNECVLNSNYGRKLSAASSIIRYGVPRYSMTPEFKERFRRTMLERYGVDSPMKSDEILKKAQRTNIERYGGVAPTCDESVIRKVAETNISRYGGIGLGSSQTSEKIHKTMIDRYGSDVPSRIPEIREKIVKTCLERYGFTSPAMSENVKEKRRKTFLMRYGVDNAMKLHEFAMRARCRADATMAERYGDINPSHISIFRKKSICTNIRKYGVPFYVLTKECMDANKHHKISKINIRFGEMLHDFGIEYEYEYFIHRNSYDFRIGNTLLEINPTITHNSAVSVFSNRGPKTPTYHLEKTKIAHMFDFRCVHVFDWDDVDRVLSLFTQKSSIYARNCSIQAVDQKTADSFTRDNHIQGSCRGQSICYGLYYKGDLVQVMTFGRPRYNKKYDYELLRLCSRTDVRVIGGASKLFKGFLRDNPGKSVISYCDLSKFCGEVYMKIGMKLSHVTKPAKVWSKGSGHITDNILRKHGFDRLFGTSYGKGVSNEQLMLEHKWYPVYDCGQAVFIYD